MIEEKKIGEKSKSRVEKDNDGGREKRKKRGREETNNDGFRRKGRKVEEREER